VALGVPIRIPATDESRARSNIFQCIPAHGHARPYQTAPNSTEQHRTEQLD
jgi:hypothetical protein